MLLVYHLYNFNYINKLAAVEAANSEVEFYYIGGVVWITKVICKNTIKGSLGT